MEYYSVDRVYEDHLVCVDAHKRVFELDRARCKDTVREGDLLVLGANGLYVVDREATDKRRKALFKQQKNIFTD